MPDCAQLNLAHGLPRGEAIARLNDTLRTTASGGRIMVTKGVLSLSGFNNAALLAALAAYDQFDVDNDPHGERDFGDLELFGATLLFKIDYFDSGLEYGSSDPADPAVTTRVLTVMLETEY